ncbi:lipoprotein 17-related variable surface protein [Mycoplasma iguanae]|uniref:Lipoprotein 17-related variable surface protein n=1 Tax=Mycoplasma iguanae TaxID=292461 RepID=A0ABY5R9K5_9MOLU|nr:lipoprotein 17-related variable surface protein [Mycoplasma iguanae]UVD81857.1 lipoprotein 17-related variable surface protein [Mycoplasma iguanae]
MKINKKNLQYLAVLSTFIPFVAMSCAAAKTNTTTENSKENEKQPAAVSPTQPVTTNPENKPNATDNQNTNQKPEDSKPQPAPVKPANPDKESEIVAEKALDNLFTNFTISLKDNLFASEYLSSNLSNHLNKNKFNITTHSKVSHDNVTLTAKDLDTNAGTMTVVATISQNGKNQSKEYKLTTSKKLGFFNVVNGVSNFNSYTEYKLYNNLDVTLENPNTKGKNIDQLVNDFNSSSISNEQKIEKLKEITFIAYKFSNSPAWQKIVTPTLKIKSAEKKDESKELVINVVLAVNFTNIKDSKIETQTFESKASSGELQNSLKIPLEQENSVLKAFNEIKLKNNSFTNITNIYPSWYQKVFNQEVNEQNNLLFQFSNEYPEITTNYYGQNFHGNFYFKQLTQESSSYFANQWFDIPNELANGNKYYFKISNVYDANDAAGTMKVILEMYKINEADSYDWQNNSIAFKTFDISGVNKWQASDINKFSVKIRSNKVLNSWTTLFSFNNKKITGIWNTANKLDLSFNANGFNLNAEPWKFFDLYFDNKILNLKNPNNWPYPIDWEFKTISISEIYVQNKRLYITLKYSITVNGQKVEKTETLDAGMHIEGENNRYYVN